jgi:hypothetical protein
VTRPLTEVQIVERVLAILKQIEDLDRERQQAVLKKALAHFEEESQGAR